MVTWEMNVTNIRRRDGLVAVFPDAAVSVGVVGLGALTLDTGSIHRPRAAQLAAGVAPAAQAGLERDWE